MYYICVYDAEEKRINKIHKILRKYLHWVQNSVFEGELSESQLEKLKLEISKVIKSDKDSIIIYSMEKKWMNREIIGKDKSDLTNII